jgi:hypothetical protein
MKEQTMNTESSVEQLLRWRLARAEARAPAPPRGQALLELARPWWEAWPARFQSLVGQVRGIQIVYGHAMTGSQRVRAGHPVPTIVAGNGRDLETSATILYFNVSNGRLRLRFQLDIAPDEAEETFEVAFVEPAAVESFLPAEAVLAMATEYRVEVGLSKELAREWESLKVTDPMPFRLILHTVSAGV